MSVEYLNQRIPEPKNTRTKEYLNPTDQDRRSGIGTITPLPAREAGADQRPDI